MQNSIEIFTLVNLRIIVDTDLGTITYIIKAKVLLDTNTSYNEAVSSRLCTEGSLTLHGVPPLHLRPRGARGRLGAAVWAPGSLAPDS